MARGAEQATCHTPNAPDAFVSRVPVQARARTADVPRQQPSPRARGFVTPFYRYNNPFIGDHFYTPNFAGLGNGAGGYNLEGFAGSLFTSIFANCGAVPLYRFYSPAAELPPTR